MHSHCYVALSSLRYLCHRVNTEKPKFRLLHYNCFENTYLKHLSLRKRQSNAQRLLKGSKMLTWLQIVIFHAFLEKRHDLLNNSEISKLFQINFATSFELDDLHTISIFCWISNASIFHIQGLRILFGQIAKTC